MSGEPLVHRRGGAVRHHLLISNIIAVKLFALGPLVLPAGVVIFPISYIVGDVLTEVYGYARARQVIWLGFGCNCWPCVVIAGRPGAAAGPFWAPNQAAYETILGFAPRLLVASFMRLPGRRVRQLGRAGADEDRHPGR